MTKAEIGLIGLGVMGANLALNMAGNGYSVAVHNRTSSRTGAFFENAGELREHIIPCSSLDELVAQIKPPRPIILMVQAGKAVDEQIEALRGLLERNDILIDAGNANYRDTMRRFAELEDSGLTFIGMGVSGGAEGARHGPSIMVGGEREAYQRIEPVLNSIAARYEGEPCQAWLGPGGAGHFVKTVHNGIEYADMQMIAEIYGLLRDGSGMKAADIGKLFERWNKGPLDSYLIEISAEVLSAQDPETGSPVVDIILDRAGQKGTGRWAAIEAQLMGVPATTIEAAVAARSLSADTDLRKEALKQLGPASGSAGSAPPYPTDLVSDLEMALLAGKVAAYAQGFAVMAEASSEYRWELPLATIASIWRAGCIIRSQFLDVIAKAAGRDSEMGNLMLVTEFAEMMKTAEAPLRRVVGHAIASGLPVPALASALAYFDSLRRGRDVANLIQAQRDFFGAHGFERIDRDGEHHGPWGQAPSGTKEE